MTSNFSRDFARLAPFGWSHHFQSQLGAGVDGLLPARVVAVDIFRDRVTVRAEDGSTRVVALEQLRQEVEAAGDALGAPKGPPRG